MQYALQRRSGVMLYWGHTLSGRGLWWCPTMQIKHCDRRSCGFQGDVLPKGGVDTNLVSSFCFHGKWPIYHLQSLEVFKKRVDVALRKMVSGHGADGLMVGLDDLSGLFQHQWLCDSVIQWCLRVVNEMHRKGCKSSATARAVMALDGCCSWKDPLSLAFLWKPSPANLGGVRNLWSATILHPD